MATNDQHQWRTQGEGGPTDKIFLISCSFYGKTWQISMLIPQGWRPLIRTILDPPLNTSVMYMLKVAAFS